MKLATQKLKCPPFPDPEAGFIYAMHSGGYELIIGIDADDDKTHTLIFDSDGHPKSVFRHPNWAGGFAGRMPIGRIAPGALIFPEIETYDTTECRFVGEPSAPRTRTSK